MNFFILQYLKQVNYNDKYTTKDYSNQSNHKKLTKITSYYVTFNNIAHKALVIISTTL